MSHAYEQWHYNHKKQRESAPPKSVSEPAFKGYMSNFIVKLCPNRMPSLPNRMPRHPIHPQATMEAVVSNAHSAEAVVAKAKADARKCMTSNCFIARKVRVENAVGCLVDAAYSLSTSSFPAEAADCLECAAGVRAGEGDDAAGAAKLLDKAGRLMSRAAASASTSAAFRSDYTLQADELFVRASECYAQAGALTKAAKLCDELGTRMERAGDLCNAHAQFERACTFAESVAGGNDFAVRTYLEKQGLASALLKQYGAAAKCFEAIGVELSANRLARYTARKFFARAIVCLLAADDAVGAQEALAKFARDDYTFASSTEGRFVALLVEATGKCSPSDFRAAFRDFAESKATLGTTGSWLTAVLAAALRRLTAHDWSTDSDDAALEERETLESVRDEDESVCDQDESVRDQDESVENASDKDAGVRDEDACARDEDESARDKNAGAAENAADDDDDSCDIFA